MESKIIKQNCFCKTLKPQHFPLKEQLNALDLTHLTVFLCHFPYDKEDKSNPKGSLQECIT